MSIVDLEKKSHQRFSTRYYNDNLAFKRIERRAIEERKRDIYLGMANDATLEGNLTRAETLRQVAVGMLPRAWATLH